MFNHNLKILGWYVLSFDLQYDLFSDFLKKKHRLVGCLDDEFACQSGYGCLDRSLLCDNLLQCLHGSDEVGCGKIPKMYAQNVFTVESIDPLKSA